MHVRVLPGRRRHVGSGARLLTVTNGRSRSILMTVYRVRMVQACRGGRPSCSSTDVRLTYLRPLFHCRPPSLAGNPQLYVLKRDAIDAAAGSWRPAVRSGDVGGRDIADPV